MCLLGFAKDQAFDYETLRAAAYAPYDGAYLGEVLATAALIEEGDWESRHTRWPALGARIEGIAESAHAAGHEESARSACLRASNYYRTAEFFLRDDPVNDPRVLATWRKAAACFDAAAALTGPSWRRVEIPYEGIALDGYFFPAEGDGPHPTLLAYGGFDSTLEEPYFTAAAPALRRGWNCLAFEGPGQGAALRRHGLPPAWRSTASTTWGARCRGARNPDAARSSSASQRKRAARNTARWARSP